MIAVNYTTLRDNMKDCFDSIADKYETMIVTRKDENMVIMSQSTYDSLMETLYLYGSKANYDHIMQSISQYKSGRIASHALDEVNV